MSPTVAEKNKPHSTMRYGIWMQEIEAQVRTWHELGQCITTLMAYWNHLGNFNNIPLPGPNPQRDSALMGLACSSGFIDFLSPAGNSNVQPALKNTKLEVIFSLMFHNYTDGWKCPEELALAQTYF